MKKNLQKIYDDFAETYDENRGLFDMTEVLESFYNHLTVEKGNLLDLGCGAGEPFAKWFIDKGWTVTGVDFSEKMIKLASKYVPEMKTIHSDMLKVKFEPSSFDAITATYSLFHIPNKEHVALFEKFYTWLCPKGRLLFTYATKEYTGSNEFDGYKNFMGQELYYSHKNPEKLYSDLKNIGFDIESKKYRNIGGETFLWVTVCKL
ncbi:MAG: class I SAM-dependent methyltransferase [Candidatus Delongbacteria bacterium]|nr:class I SAM-dependent methyltransferase [Candidatus Delongbacteria bacterium]